MAVAHSERMETLRSILVPIDGSPPSLAALDHAVTLASDYDARLDVLHVVPPEDPLSEGARAEIESAMETTVDHVRSLMGDRVEVHKIIGDPVREIVERAAEDCVDLIVIGTHGRVGRLHSLLGSVAEGVVRNAPCPVLTVRDASGGYQSFAERRHGRPSLAEQSEHVAAACDTQEAHRPR